jgi:predicted HAD superfamily hydrolase
MSVEPRPNPAGARPSPWSDPSAVFRYDESLVDVAEVLDSAPRRFTTLSFDFFDTVVARFCAEPWHLFIELGRKLQLIDSIDPHVDPESFLTLRRTAEARARRRSLRERGHAECSVGQIYRELEHVVRDPGTAAQLEHTLECDWCYLNPSVVSLLRHGVRLGYRILVHSDTYYSAPDLRQILQTNGLDPSCIDRIFTSSDHGRFKADGGLFQVGLRRTKLDPAEVLHLGDNYQADCLGAGRAGIPSKHYYRHTSYTTEVVERERRVAAALPQPAASPNSVRVLAQRLVDPADPEAQEYRDGAFLLGPMLAPFAEWCVEQLARDGVRRVLALMREGGLLGKLLHRAASAQGYELEVVPFYTSRQATSLAAVGKVTQQSLAARILWRSPPTVGEFLRTLGLRQGEIALDADILARRIDSPQMRQAILTHLTRGALRRTIEERSARQRDLVLRYVKQGIGGHERIGLVDLGWGGTIQRNLQRILRLEGHDTALFGYYLATAERAAEVRLDGSRIRGYLSRLGAPRGLAQVLLWHPEILEETVSSTVGSTEGYRLDPRGRIRPVLGARRCDHTERRRKLAVQRGILAYQAAWQHVRGVAPRAAGSRKSSLLDSARRAEIDQQALIVGHRLIGYPTRAEAERFGGFQHEDNFGSEVRQPILHPKSVSAFERGGVLGLYRELSTYWPQGVIATVRPEVVRQLSAGWSDPLVHGDWGAVGELGSPGELSRAERQGLATLMVETAPALIVLCGHRSKRQRKWVTEQAKQLKAQGRVRRTPRVEAVLPGSGGSVARQLLAASRPGAKTLLVVDADTAAEENAVSPVEVLGAALPPGSVIAVRHGVEPFEISVAEATINGTLWLQQQGSALGYRCLDAGWWTPDLHEAFLAWERDGATIERGARERIGGPERQIGVRPSA